MLDFDNHISVQYQIESNKFKILKYKLKIEPHGM